MSAAAARGRRPTSPQDLASHGVSDFAPVSISQYQHLQLRQQPPPPSISDSFDEDDTGGYRYPGSGVGVLPSTGFPANGMSNPHPLPLRSNSHPQPSTSNNSEFVVPPQPLQAHQTLFTTATSVAATQQTIPSSFNGGGDNMQGNVSETSPPPQAQGGSSGNAPYLRVARFVGPPPVPLACTECRSRHLKCDAGTPSCGRCVTDARECTYVKSRRGWKGSRRRAHGSTSRAGSVSGNESGFGVMSDGGGDGRGELLFFLTC